MKARRRSRRSSVEAKLARRSSLRARMENQSSIWFSQEQCLGVYTKRTRCVASVRKAVRVAIDCRMPLFSLTPRSSVIWQRAATSRTSVSERRVSRWSATKIQAASGSSAIVRSMWAAKSASVRVGPTDGAMTAPVATAKLAISAWVPWRTYSNSRRSTWPGRSGSVGAARSSAWMPVISSVPTPWTPWSWRAGAAAYRSQTACTCAAKATGSSTRGVSQYRLRWGLSAAASRNQKPPDAAGGDTAHDAPRGRLISQFAGRPLADGTARVPRWLAGDRHDLAQLLGRERRWRPRPWRIRQHTLEHGVERAVVVRAAFQFRGQQRLRRGGPPVAPGLHGVPRQGQLRRQATITRPVRRPQDDPRPGGHCLGRARRPHQLQQHAALAGRDYDLLGARQWHRPVLLGPLPYHLLPCASTSAKPY